MSTYRLTARASQVCLASLLTRQHLSQLIPAEFAKLTGLAERSVLLAFRELEQAGLTLIITQGVIDEQATKGEAAMGQVVLEAQNRVGEVDEQVPLVGEPVLADKISHALQVESLESQGQVEEEPGDTEESDSLGANDEEPTMVDPVSILSLQGVVDSHPDRSYSGSAGQNADGMGEVLGQGGLDPLGGGYEKADRLPSVSALTLALLEPARPVLQGRAKVEKPIGLSLDEEEENDPLEYCRLADEAGDRKAQMAALSLVWAEAFPLPEYEFSQLSDSFAKWLTQNGRSAEWVGGTIQRIGHGGKHLEWPSSYVRKAVEGEEKRASQQTSSESQVEITDELRALNRLAIEQYG